MRALFLVGHHKLQTDPYTIWSFPVFFLPIYHSLMSDHYVNWMLSTMGFQNESLHSDHVCSLQVCRMKAYIVVKLSRPSCLAYTEVALSANQAISLRPDLIFPAGEGTQCL